MHKVVDIKIKSFVQFDERPGFRENAVARCSDRQFTKNLRKVNKSEIAAGASVIGRAKKKGDYSSSFGSFVIMISFTSTTRWKSQPQSQEYISCIVFS
jgi:hypothetical protein